MQLEMVVEIPEGSRNKYEMDHAIGRIRLDRTLFTAAQYPADYGYIPGTVAENGDPLDALVPLGQPTFPGCTVRVRPVAVFWMHDENGPDAKILCVATDDPRMDHIRDLNDVPQHQLNEISHFFDIYKELEPCKSGEARGWQGLADAERLVNDARRRADAGEGLPGLPAPALGARHFDDGREHRTA
ncbi:inorganic diphosphatase [Saccharopolyspora spinosa]|uniref:Inorganic pyrophosphatase n=1 Tax=Saccharopolyspora spinosa TaxID=60894 RepID=A0A2N3Y4S0_SACSN|nr:inorganic diphosphatase [Saccharopolyspora spinosa]PKW17904.1 inorganic pyrophosphatase [Saccharopolyspora spinosa]